MKPLAKMVMTQMRSEEPEARRDRYGRYALKNEINNGFYNSTIYRQEGARYDGQQAMPEHQEPEDRFRDRTGREHYNNGRYAPMRSELHEPMGRGYYQDDSVPPVHDTGTGYRYDNGNRLIGFAGGSEYRNDYRMDAGYQSRDELSNRSGQKQSGHAYSSVRPMDRKTAHEWVQKMHNADGSMGEHWTYDQTSQVMKQRNMDCNPAEFYAVINAMWSDYGKVAEKYGINNVDFWAEMAKAFIMDKDAMPDKAALYYECIVK